MDTQMDLKGGKGPKPEQRSDCEVGNEEIKHCKSL